MPAPPSAQYPRPCSAPTNISFVPASTTKPWFGKGYKTTKLTATSGPEAVAACEEICRNGVDTSGSQRGCIAFAVTDTPRGAKACHQWRRNKFPPKVCESSDSKGLCSRTSDGAYRLVYGYGSS
jgi:hypothetical protein